MHIGGVLQVMQFELVLWTLKENVYVSNSLLNVYDGFVQIASRYFIE